MKKLLLFGIILSAGSLSAQAQTTRFGLKAGANYSNVYLNGITRPERLWGFAAGGFAQIPLTQDGFFSVQPELIYSAKGSKTSLSFGGEYRQRLHYIELPVLAKINASGFIAELGPQVSFLAAARFETPNGTSTDLEGSNRLALGAVAGVGYQLPMGLSITLRYANDLTKLSPNGPRNTLYQAQLGYLFAGK
ncbi:PorT family protein [Hymenobacter aerilatus]|uniref:PorT family protein n=1 Tax=Hymenobacter aerilatus TaxID=2932251 RepID=A0A8T9SY42_9BACT|nr:porin family protein [Hymenobacter aerilatus]UOR06785.1 PorT family protein [Hymenobacter aerilatus]